MEHSFLEEAEQYLSVRGVLPVTGKKYGVTIDPGPTLECLKIRLNQDFNGDQPQVVLWFDAGWTKDGHNYLPSLYLARCFPPIVRYGRAHKFLGPYEHPQQPYILPSSWEKAHLLDTPVVVTEGPVRSLLLDQCGFCGVSLTGVWNAAEKRSEEAKAKGEPIKLHPVLRKWTWTNREVFLAFDQDYLVNQTVLHALIRNIVLFHAAGSVVKILRWPKEAGKGLDDYVHQKAGLSVPEQTKVLQELVQAGISTIDFFVPPYLDLVFTELETVAMSATRRDQLAKEWAKKLGTTAESLRSKKKSPEVEAASEVGTDPEPWEMEVDIDEVLEDLHTLIKTYVAAESYDITIVVFWIVFTWIWEQAHYLPLLVITSPERECGKSTLRDLIIALARRSMQVTSLPDGSIHRLVGMFRPTLCVDEAEGLGEDRNRENTKAVLNSGFEHDEKIPRFNMEGGIFEFFDPACPKLVSGIGTFLKDTTLSRSFIIEMRRVTPQEEATLTDGAFFDPKAPAILELRRKLLRWAIDNAKEYRRLSRDIMREMPVSIRGRNKNKFATLFAIAKLAKGHWTELVTQAAFLLLQETAAHANVSLEHRLLCDCYRVVTTCKHLLIPGVKGRPFITTDNLIEAVCLLPETPWNAMPKSGKRLTPNHLYFLLKRYKIESKRLPKDGPRGVYVETILEEYTRYSGKGAASPSSAPSSPSEEKNSGDTPIFGGPVDPQQVNPLEENDLRGSTVGSTADLGGGSPPASGGSQRSIDPAGSTAGWIDGSPGGSPLSNSAIATYPIWDPPHHQKPEVLQKIFPGLCSQWDRPAHGLEGPNARFRQLLTSPSQWLGLDIETFAKPVFGKNKKKPLKTNHALNPWMGDVRLITFADQEHIYLCDLISGFPDAELRSRLCSAGWIVHNAKFELLYLGLHFNLIPEAIFCTWIGNALLTNGRLHHTREIETEVEPAAGEPKKSKKGKKPKLNSLKKALSEQLAVDLPKELGDSDWGAKELTQAQRDYSLNDVRFSDPLASKQLASIRAEGLETVCMLEMLLLPVIVKMERHGFAVDRDKLESRRREYATLTEQKKEHAKSLLGEGCPKLGDSWKEKGLLDWIEDRTGVRLPDLTEETLLQWQNPIGHALVDYKQTNKRLRTFESLLEHSKLDGRVHPILNPMGAVTGRFSCAEPNAQQMEKAPNLFRDCYIASGPDRILVVSDFKHIEMRTAAIFANAVTKLHTLLDLFKEGLDPHTMTAAAILHRAIEEVTKTDRQLSKAVNFGFIYGQQAEGFLTYAKSNYGIVLSLSEAEQFRSDYFRQYPDLAGWHRWAWNEVENGVTESRTILGRRHLIPASTSKWNKFQALVNTPASGSTADLIKWSMIELDRVLPSDTHQVMCVHDELVVDAPLSRAGEIKKLMERVMAETFAKLFDDIIPGPAEANFGPNWEAAKP